MLLENVTMQRRIQCDQIGLFLRVCATIFLNVAKILDKFLGDI